MKRPRYQHGFFSKIRRKKGPNVWLYRWREVDPKGKPQMRSLVIGTVKEYKTESAAWTAVETLRLNVNQEALRPDAVALTLKQTVEHYRAIELDVEVESERKTFKTKQVYDSNLQTHIEPRWGEYRLRDITAVAVERWLERLEMAGSSKAKLKYVMSDVYQHAIRYGWLRNDENPLLAVRQSAKREQVPETLEAHEFRALMLKLPQKLRTMGIICDDRSAHQRGAWAEMVGHRLEKAGDEGQPLGGLRAGGQVQNRSLQAAGPSRRTNSGGVVKMARSLHLRPAL